jgi:hypothetical protein
MFFTVPLAIFGWPLVVLAIFLALPPRRAIICSVVGAWMFLPMATYDLPGIPDISKMSIASISVFLCTVGFHFPQYSKIQLSWWDCFIFFWLAVPFPAAVVNGYGVYEGLSIVLSQVFAWGLPYLVGRAFFGTSDSLSELAFGIFVAGLVYAPLVLFEMKVSPQLHTWVYGYHQHTFSQARKGDGWRPTVFMQHGLAVAMFMATSSITGLWLWLSGRTKKLLGSPIWVFTVPLFLVSVSCRSSYALLLQVTGVGAILSLRFFKLRVFLLSIVMIAPIYLIARTVVGWDAQILKDIASEMGSDRARSLNVRLTSEDIILDWMNGHEWIGRSNYSQLIVDTRRTGEKFIPDALWVIAYGKFGYIGLVSLLGALLVGPSLYFLRNSPVGLASPYAAGATSLAVVLALHACDNLQNAMINPIYMLVAGGLVTLSTAPRRLGENARFDIVVKQASSSDLRSKA